MRDSHTPASNLFLATLRDKHPGKTPVWFMRQAGRHLPEYREVRAKAGSFMDLCFNPKLASEVTLQPVRRYDMDAAILFADILLIPHALGQKVWFVAGEGPRLDPVISHKNIDEFRLKNNRALLDPIYETVRLTRAALGKDKALIGFAGAPWTVATYMLAGGPSKDPSALRRHYYENEEFVKNLMDLLVEETIDYLIKQAQAGVDAVQIFDSWAAGLPENLVNVLCLEPMEKISKGVKAAIPNLPVIFFPKGVGPVAPNFAMSSLCDGIGIDTATPSQWAKTYLSPHAVVQGGLDPLLVVHGGSAMERAAHTYLETFKDEAYIFNLGHGFVPMTPIENVMRLMEIVRQY